MPAYRAACLTLALAVLAAWSNAQAQQPIAQYTRYLDPVGELYGKVARLNRSQIATIQRGAESGNAEDQLKYGMICETRYETIGLTIAEGHAQRATWFEKAALQGNAYAQRL